MLTRKQKADLAADTRKLLYDDFGIQKDWDAREQIGEAIRRLAIRCTEPKDFLFLATMIDGGAS